MDKTAVEYEDKEKDVKFDKKSFWQRLARIFQSWKQPGKAWGEPKFGALFLLVGAQNEEVSYPKTIAMQQYLFGYELTDTAIVFVGDTLHVLTSAKKEKMLQDLGTEGEEKGVTYKLVVTIRNKADHYKSNFADLLALLADKGRVGGIPKDLKDCVGGDFAKRCLNTLKEGGVEVMDAAAGCAEVLLVKDHAALSNIKKAAWFSSQVLRKGLLQEMETTIDEDKKIKHTELAEKCEEMFGDPAKVKAKLKAENLDSCYNPIIQSGGKYDLRPSAQSSEDELHYGTIICCLGARYKMWCSNIGRTYFINPDKDQKLAYEVLIDVYTQCRDALRDGKKASGVYAAAKQAMKDAVEKKKAPDFFPHFTKNCGFSMGLEFRESALVLGEKNDRILKAGMIVNLCVGFENLKTSDPEKLKNPKTATFAVLLADTFEIRENEEPETLTHCPRKYGEVSYFIGDDGDEEDAAQNKEDGQDRGVSKRGLREQSQLTKDSKEISDQQERLRRKQREDALRRLAERNIEQGFDQKKGNDGRFKSYTQPGDLPERASTTRLYVDSNAESVLLPIYGQVVPFHIAMIKNVAKSDEGASTVLRINFLTPEENGTQRPPEWASSLSHFIKEITFRTTGKNLDKAFFEIKELRKRWQNRVRENAVKNVLVAQEDLRITSVEGFSKLRNVCVRPNLARKKTQGVLVAHENGLRFLAQTQTEKVKVDVIYKNIKHAFFQPADNSINVLLHFELHNDILLGKKKSRKTNFVQFFVEVVEASQDLDTRSRYDDDGLMEEQEERRRRQKENDRFRQFVKKVEEKLAASKDQPKIEFDVPYKDLAFQGVGHRTTVEMMPTVHSLVALEDNPPLVIPLSEVEIANFERVQFQLRNFDLTFVFRDFNKLPHRIDAIPMKYLDSIKQWLNSCDIVFFETAQNMLWKNIMKTIRKDPGDFYAEGGWNFLRAEDDGEEAGEGDEPEPESASEFEPEEVEGDSTDDEEYASDSEEEDASEGSEVSGEDEGDEGESWEDLDKKAKEDDKEMNRRRAEEDRKVAQKKAEERSGAKRKKPGSLGDGAKKQKTAPSPAAKPSGAKPTAKPGSSSGSSGSKPGAKPPMSNGKAAATSSKPSSSSSSSKPLAKPSGSSSSSSSSSKGAIPKQAPKPASSFFKPPAAGNPKPKQSGKPAK